MSAPAAPATPPGRIWYLVAVGIFLVGMAAMAAFLITRLMGMDSGLTRFVVPGEADADARRRQLHDLPRAAGRRSTARSTPAARSRA